MRQKQTGPLAGERQRPSGGRQTRPRSLAVGMTIVVLVGAVAVLGPTSPAAAKGSPIQTQTLPVAVAGQYYSTQLLAVSNTPTPYTWSVSSGALPTGLSLDAATGWIAGTSTTPSTASFIISLTTPSYVGTSSFTLTTTSASISNVAILNASTNPTIDVWGSNLGSAPVGSSFSACNGTGSNFGVVPYAFPGSLTFSDPSANWDAGISSCRGPGFIIDSYSNTEATFSFGSAYGSSGVVLNPGDVFDLSLNGASFTASAIYHTSSLSVWTTHLPDATIGQPYSATLAATGGTKPYNWSATGLPTGLSLDPPTGVISGTPTSTSTNSLSLQVTDAASTIANATVPYSVGALTVVPASTVHSALYAGEYFQHLGASADVETTILQEVANETYASNPTADPTAVMTELSSLRTTLEAAGGVGLVRFGPNLEGRAASAIPSLLSFSQSSASALTKTAAVNTAIKTYGGEIDTSKDPVRVIIGPYSFVREYPSTPDQSVVPAAPFIDDVAVPTIEQAASCATVSAACATVTDSLLQSTAQVPAELGSYQLTLSDPIVMQALAVSNLTVAADGTITTSSSLANAGATQFESMVMNSTLSLDGDISQLIAQEGNLPGLWNSASTQAQLQSQAAQDVADETMFLKMSATVLPALQSIITFLDPSAGALVAKVLPAVVQLVDSTSQLATALGQAAAAGAAGSVATPIVGVVVAAITLIIALATSNSSSGPSEAYLLAQHTDDMITRLQDVMNSQFKAVDNALNQIFAALTTGFQQINWQLNTLSGSVSQLIANLAGAQASIDLVDTHLFSVVGDTVRSGVQGHIDQCDNYQHIYGSPLPFTGGLPSWTACEGSLYTDAITNASQSSVAGPESGNVDNSSLSTSNNLTNYDPTMYREILYVLSQRYPTLVHAPSASLVNVDLWSSAALAYRELLDENPTYAAALAPSRLSDIETVGQQAAQALDQLSQTEYNGSTTYAPVIDAVTGNYTSALTDLQTVLTNTESSFKNTTDPNAAVRPSMDIDLFGNPEQTVPADVTPNLGSTDTSVPACSAGNGSLPYSMDGPSDLRYLAPNSWILSYWLKHPDNLNNSAYSVCWEPSTVVTSHYCGGKPPNISCTYYGNISVSVDLNVVDPTTNVSTNLQKATKQIATGVYLYSTSGPSNVLTDVHSYFSSQSVADSFMQTSAAQVNQSELTAVETDLQSRLTKLASDMFASDKAAADGGATPAVAGAFNLLRSTSVLSDPSATSGDQILRDLLYGKDQLLGSADGGASTFDSLLSALTASPQGGVWESAISSAIANASKFDSQLTSYLVTASANPGSAPSDIAITTTEAILQAGSALESNLPSPPVSVAAVAGAGSATVSWQPPVSPGSTPINAYRVTPYLVGLAQTPITYSSTTTTQVIGGLTNGSGYTFTVQASNAAGWGPPSTASPSVVIGSPAAPRVVKAVSGSTTTSTGTLQVSFILGANNGSPITSQKATCTSSNGGVTKSATHTGATAAVITVSAVTTGKSYTCTVTETNTPGTSPASLASGAVIVGSPAAPTGVTAVRVSAGQLKVKFTAGANNGSPITGLSASCTSSNGGVAGSKSGSGSPLTLTGLTGGKSYTCTVKASNARGSGLTSKPSAVVTA